MAFGCAALVQFAAAGAAASASQERTAPEQQVTVTGCIQRETDYRRARDAGRGGVAGTGVGAGNEFVLVNASMAKSSGSGATGTAGTSASAASETAYELTGENESKAGQYVGRRVEISGTLMAAEVSPSSKPTGGATAGKAA
jgi:hypothetical protein